MGASLRIAGAPASDPGAPRGAGSTSCTSPTRSSRPGYRIASRSMMFASSRTLPGQRCARSAVIASGVKVGAARPVRVRCSAVKCVTNASMSSTRSRSGGSVMGITFRRKNRSSRKLPSATAVTRSRLVAATMRTSTLIGLPPPTRSISRASMARSSFACASLPRSPTSSRKSVPPCASSNRPMRRSVAPVNAPRSCPNISLSTRSRGIAAQFVRTYALSRRGLPACSAPATSSLPVPDSPAISTRASLGATRAISSRTFAIAGLSPTSPPTRPRSSRNVRAARRVCRSSSAEPSARIVPSGVSGFSRKVNAPSRVAFTASLNPARPLIITTGNSGNRSRNFASVSMPSVSFGIIRSSSTTSGSASSARANAACPSGASRTS